MPIVDNFNNIYEEDIPSIACIEPLTHEDYAVLRAHLLSDSCPEGLCVYYPARCLLTTAGIFDLAETLKSGKCKSGLTLLFRSPREEEREAHVLAIRYLTGALKSGNTPHDLTLDFCGYSFSDDAMKFLANALMSGRCSSGLTLRFNENNLSDFAIDLLAQALESGRCPQGLKLHLTDLSSQNEYKQLRLSAALLSGQCPKDLALTLNFSSRKMNIFCESLMAGQSPEGLSLNLHEDNTSLPNFLNNDLGLLPTALQSGKCPKGLTLYLNQSYIGEEDFKRLCMALQSGHCPENLSLFLGGRGDCDGVLSDIYTNHLVAALVSGRCPKGLFISLENIHIKEEEMERLASSFASGKLPVGFSLNVGDIFKIDGVKLLTTAIASGNSPKNLSLSFTSEVISVRALGIRALATFLVSGSCPSNLTLNLINMYLRKEEMLTLQEGLISGKCPSKLTINFSGTLNTLTSDFISGLTSKGCAQDLTIILHNTCKPSLEASIVIALYRNATLRVMVKNSRLVRALTLANIFLKKYPGHAATVHFYREIIFRSVMGGRPPENVALQTLQALEECPGYHVEGIKIASHDTGEENFIQMCLRDALGLPTQRREKGVLPETTSELPWHPSKSNSRGSLGLLDLPDDLLTIAPIRDGKLGPVLQSSIFTSLNTMEEQIQLMAALSGTHPSLYTFFKKDLSKYKKAAAQRLSRFVLAGDEECTRELLKYSLRY